MLELLQISVEGGEPLTVEAAKLYLRVDDPVEDDGIEAFCIAAREAAERETSRILRTAASYRLRMKYEAICGHSGLHVQDCCITLPRGPLTRNEAGEITGLAVKVDGVALAASQYEVYEGENVLPLVKIPHSGCRDVEIDFIAGTPAGKLPAMLLIAMKWMVSFWYQNRDAEDQKGLLADIPEAAKNLLCGCELVG